MVGEIMININQLKELMHQKLLHNDQVISVWEGGSKATGFDDEYSDLDLMVIVRDDFVESAFTLIEDTIKSMTKIIQKYRVPEPSWHGFSQAFYLLEDVGPYFYIDLAIVKSSVPDKFTVKKRHGERFIWFEKELIQSLDVEDDLTVYKRAQKVFKQATQIDFIFQKEIIKNIDRNRFTEAFPFFFRFLSNQFAVMLNLKYRIDKVDFSLRYSYRDYPKDVQKLIEQAMKVSSIEELKSVYLEINQMYELLKQEMDNRFNN